MRDSGGIGRSVAPPKGWNRSLFPEPVLDPDNMQALWRAVQRRQRRLGPDRLAIGGLKRLS